MNEILLPGVLEKLYTYTLDNGLKIYMVPNNKTKNFYITLSTKYGSIYTNFEYNGKNYDKHNRDRCDYSKQKPRRIRNSRYAFNDFFR